MKTIQDYGKKMKGMYDIVLESSRLRDTELNCFFLSASLKGQGFDMGHQKSIWMHMNYMYHLQLIREKLYEDFFAEMKGGGILPFMDPDVYGRSLIACSSFNLSSASLTHLFKKSDCRLA
jgi:hypothetical protein